MGDFQIEVKGVTCNSILDRTRIGAALLQFLILEEGKPVSIHRLQSELWPAGRSENPESALKVTVSRLRDVLNDISPRLGQCIVSKRGTYMWEGRADILVDVTEIKSLFEQLKTDSGNRMLMKKLLTYYQGDLSLAGEVHSGVMMANYLHNEFLNAIYRYVDELKQKNAYGSICEVCQKAIEVDPNDDQLRIEMVQAFSKLGRKDEAQAELQLLKHRTRTDRDMLSEGFEGVIETSHELRIRIDAIHDELVEKEDDQRGPYFCDYEGFKVIYNIYMSNLERMGSTMFLAMIMLDEQGSATKRESCMAGLHEILNGNLRRNDIITRLSDHTYAMLLPTVNYSTGKMVLERIENLYYQELPSGLFFHARLVPLSRK